MPPSGLPDAGKRRPCRGIRQASGRALRAAALGPKHPQPDHPTRPLPTAAYEEEASQARSLLGSGGGGKDRKEDRFGALSDELGSAAASSRYKEKHGAYYAKYGIK